MLSVFTGALSLLVSTSSDSTGRNTLQRQQSRATSSSPNDLSGSSSLTHQKPKSHTLKAVASCEVVREEEALKPSVMIVTPTNDIRQRKRCKSEHN